MIKEGDKETESKRGEVQSLELQIRKANSEKRRIREKIRT